MRTEDETIDTVMTFLKGEALQSDARVLSVSLLFAALKVLQGLISSGVMTEAAARNLVEEYSAVLSEHANCEVHRVTESSGTVH